MALVIAVLIAFGIITSPDQVTNKIIDDNKTLLQKEITDFDDLEL